MTTDGVRASTRMVGILGWPVRHSLSPVMHNSEFRRLGLDYVYLAWEVSREFLEQAARGLRALGAAGYNVTIPHKQAIVTCLDELSTEAKMIGAVNVVCLKDGRAIGYNTDAAGWRDDIEQDLSLAGRSLFLIGAGGAARAVAVGACLAGVRHIVICNRRYETAEALAEVLHHHFPKLQVECAGPTSGDCHQRIRECDVIVNATPVGMAGHGGSPIPPEWLAPTHYVYDTVYTPPETPLLKAARERGCKTRNGIGMLVRQGARAFRLWTGVEPDVTEMEKALVRALTSSGSSDGT